MAAKTPAPFSLNSDFRMSLGWAIALVLFLALLFISVSSPDIALSERMKTLYLPCLFYLFALSAWLLNSWQPLLGRWLLVSGLATLVFLGAFWVGEATFFMLLVLPMVLAMALLGFSAALFITIVETLALTILASLFFSRAHRLHPGHHPRDAVAHARPALRHLSSYPPAHAVVLRALLAGARTLRRSP